MKIELLITGNEILDGSCMDVNTPYIAREIHLLGLKVRQVNLVGDSQIDLITHIHSISKRADLCVMTGGLGPTSDDLTLDALAEVAQVKLVENTKLWEEICQKLSHKSHIPEIQRRQARVPEGALSIANATGIAPGVQITINQCTFFAYPGVPYECRALVQDHLIPWIKNKTQKTFIQKILRFCWLTESEVQEKIQALQLHPSIHIGYQAMGKEHRVKLSSLRSDLLNIAIKKIKHSMRYSYLNDQDLSLKEVVLARCKSLGLTVSLAESCTGGAVCASLTSMAGSSTVVIGGVVAYSNQVKQEQLLVSEDILIQHGAVSKACAQAMAEGVRTQLRTDWGVSITGVAGPGGGSPHKPVGTVCFAWSNQSETVSERLLLKGTRNQIQHAASIYALFGLYQRIMTQESR